MSSKGRDILKSMVTAGEGAPAGPAAIGTPRSSGAVRAMNLSLGRLGEEAAEGRALKEALAAGEKVIEIDPALVGQSIVADRIPDSVDPEFDLLLQSIERSGQQVPILVRPDPDAPGRFQAAYGHRRLRAAAVLGRPVKAIVRKLSDEEMVTAQGQENGPRLDLSFIERALFAHRMRGRGFARETVARALSTDLPEVSRLLRVAEGIDTAIILAIGPAPKAGRPRWLAFTEKLAQEGARKKALAAIAGERFSSSDTNTRFALVSQALAAPAAAPPLKGLVATPSGEGVARLSRQGGCVRIAATSRAFSDFLEARLPQIVAEFEEKSR